MNPQPDNPAPPEPPKLSETDAARLRFVERLHGYEEAAFVHILRIEQTEELLELKRVAINAQWFEVAAKLAKEIKDRAPNSIPPTKASESAEPKVQSMLGAEIINAIVAEIGGYEASHHWMQGACAAVHARVMLVLNERLPAQIASAVEAARAEILKEFVQGNDELVDQRSAVRRSNYLECVKQRDQLQAELSTRRKEHEAIVGSLQAELSRVREELAETREYLTTQDVRASGAEIERDRYLATLAGALHSGLFDKVTCKELREPGEKLMAELTTERAEHTKVKAELARINELIEADKHSQMAVYNRAIILANEAQSVLTAEQQAHAITKSDFADLKSAYAAAIYRLQELGEKTIAIQVDTALDQERAAHAATKRELKQHQSMEAEDKQGFIAIWNAVQEMSPWYESNDMDWCDEILCGLNGVKAQLDQARAENEKLRKELGDKK